ncbi:MAG: GNAT family N-acetyltransferase [Lachnospiraceae bacterium]|nr:GNAT family N-acetyltransferase [Lachnospiraceae bacterium]
MKNNDAVIRKAKPSDVKEMGSCHYHCWQETYRGLIADSYLDALDEQKNMDRFEKMYQLTGGYQYVLEYENRIIGLFDMSKAREDYAPMEIQGLYLRKSFHGQGLGQRIMTFIKSECNHSSFYLWCLRNNPTCGYYEHMGGVIVDKRMINIGGREEEEVCYLFECPI